MTAAEIAKALGGHRTDGRFLCRCPVTSHGGGKGDRHPSLIIKDGSNTLLVHCLAGCDPRDILDELRKRGLLGRDHSHVYGRRHHGDRGHVRPQRTSHLPDWLDDSQQRTQAALRLWNEAGPLLDTIGWRYFTERHELHIGALDDLSHALRWHEHSSAIIALMTDPLTGEATGVHRTFLATDGTKISRKMLGRQGVIRLTPDEEVTMGLGLTEGLEDGLSVLLWGWRPVWVATSAGAIARFPILVGIEALTIFADADTTGMKAARSCAARWTEGGAEVTICPPPGGAHG